MRFDAKDEEGRHVLVKTSTGMTMKYARACDTDEKWVEVAVVAGFSEPRRLAVHMLQHRGSVVYTKLHVDYDVVNKATGETLHQVRQ